MSLSLATWTLFSLRSQRYFEFLGLKAAAAARLTAAVFAFQIDAVTPAAPRPTADPHLSAGAPPDTQGGYKKHFRDNA